MVAPERALSPKQQLKLIVRRIVEAYAPEKIILYGSYAYGTPGPDSDFDLLIVKETTDPMHERWFKVQKAIWPLPTTISTESLVVTQAELDRRLQIGDQFFQEIVSQGKVIYERQRVARPRRVVHVRRARPRVSKSVARRP
jgi:predicted nucleotidyltransferase